MRIEYIGKICGDCGKPATDKILGSKNDLYFCREHYLKTSDQMTKNFLAITEPNYTESQSLDCEFSQYTAHKVTDSHTHINWIPCSERMPEYTKQKAREFLVTVKLSKGGSLKNKRDVLSAYYGTIGYGSNSGYGWIRFDVPMPYEVVAWAEMPEPWEPPV